MVPFNKKFSEIVRTHPPTNYIYPRSSLTTITSIEQDLNSYEQAVMDKGVAYYSDPTPIPWLNKALEQTDKTSSKSSWEHIDNTSLQTSDISGFYYIPFNNLEQISEEQPESVI